MNATNSWHWNVPCGIIHFKKIIRFRELFEDRMQNVRPPLWSSGQCFWLQIQRSRFYSQHYQIFWEVVGLERGPLSLVSTTEELLDRKSSGSSLEIREYSHRDPSRWPCGSLYMPKFALTSPASGSRSFGIVRSRTQAMEYFYVKCNIEIINQKNKQN
jgi:hypothetical protein